MAVIHDPANDFDFAYKGFQYPLPPSWKRAVRLEDQIQWLMQALLMVNATGVSMDELSNAIANAVTALESELTAGDDAVRAELRATAYVLEQAIKEINAGVARSRNPVTGHFDFVYVVFKQMYDMLRTYSMTYDELKATGMTYDELKDTGYTWFEVDMFANTYFGDGLSRVKYTTRDTIDINTPGY